MQLGLSGRPPSDPGRRPACDRCRGQKLRCERFNISTDGACRRCVRAGMPCITTTSPYRRNQMNRALMGIHNPPYTAVSPSSSYLAFISTMPHGAHVTAEPGYPLFAGWDHLGTTGVPESSHYLTATGTENAVWAEPPAMDPVILEAQCISTSPAALDNPDQRWITPGNTLRPPTPSLSPSSLVTSGRIHTPFTEGNEDFALDHLDWDQPVAPVAATVSSSEGEAASLPTPSLWLRSNSPDHSEDWTERFSQMSAQLLKDMNLLEGGMVAGSNRSLSQPPSYPVAPTTTTTTSLPTPTTIPGYDVFGPGPPHGNPPVQPPSSVDGLLALLIKTCHTALLRTCKGVFALVLESLPAAAEVSSGAGFEPQLPAIHLDGFEIRHRKILQIQILMHVARDLFRQIEQVMCALELGPGPGLGPASAGADLERQRDTILTRACDVRILREAICRTCTAIDAYLENGEEQ
ncbi:hypothetical protein BJY00DRAFT_316962 [Aspergillus carlsbadensis]|nr:hypothetical protein BJY00DRAFT_316962 [Aspergillus carlsbadensis]